ncbi:MAG TPA: hypothetical protein P5179_11735, partial [Candidatus Latescibacteria bacterium]|nr:hypothetical protein [Candidatus Latescibacterota bacterium]
VFLLFLWQKHGTAALTGIRDTFAARDLSTATVITKLQNATGVAMRDLLSEFWVWSYFSGDRYRPQFFAEGAHYKPAPLDSVRYPAAAKKGTLRSISSVRDTTCTFSTQFLGAQLLRIVPDGSAGGVVVSLSGVSPNVNNWSLRLAVANSDSVTFVAVTIDKQTGVREAAIPPSIWRSAYDVILVAANDAVAGSAVAFSCRIRYVDPDAIGALGVVQIPGGPTAFSVRNDARNVVVLRLRVTPSVTEQIGVSSLTVQAFGTADDSALVAPYGIKLHHDINDDGLIDADVDTILARASGFPNDNGSTTLLLGGKVVTAAESWILSYD